jgi:hypothetical protein
MFFSPQGPEESPLIFKALELFVSAICLQLWLLLGSAFGFSLFFLVFLVLRVPLAHLAAENFLGIDKGLVFLIRKFCKSSNTNQRS